MPAILPPKLHLLTFWIFFPFLHQPHMQTFSGPMERWQQSSEQLSFWKITIFHTGQQNTNGLGRNNDLELIKLIPKEDAVKLDAKGSNAPARTSCILKIFVHLYVCNKFISIDVVKNKFKIETIRFHQIASLCPPHPEGTSDRRQVSEVY